MAHFTKLGIGNIVETVEVVHNDVATTEQAGVDFLNNLYKTNDVWKQTSYNTIGGVHTLDGTPFRKNYAGIGYKYDEDRDAFIPPKLYESWTLNESTCLWNPPIPKPADEYEIIDGLNTIIGRYEWNESTTSWDKIEV